VRSCMSRMPAHVSAADHPVQSIFADWGQRWLYIAATPSAFRSASPPWPRSWLAVSGFSTAGCPQAPRSGHSAARGAAVFVGYRVASGQRHPRPELIALFSAAMVLFVTGCSTTGGKCGGPEAPDPTGLRGDGHARGSCCGLPAEWGVWADRNLLLTGTGSSASRMHEFFRRMDGLAAGLGPSSRFSWGWWPSRRTSRFWVDLLAVLGSCLGFLPYNFRRRVRRHFSRDAAARSSFCPGVHRVYGIGRGPAGRLPGVAGADLLAAHFRHGPHHLRRILTGKVKQFSGMDRVRGQGPPAPPPGRRARQPAQGGAFHY